MYTDLQIIGLEYIGQVWYKNKHVKIPNIICYYLIKYGTGLSSLQGQ